MDLNDLKEKAELAQSEQYKKVRKYQLDKIVSLSTSQIKSSELKGMLKQIASTDSWVSDYEKELKKIR